MQMQATVWQAAADVETLAVLWPWFWPAVAGALGAVLASFSCVVAERLPKGLSVSGRSVCVCERQLHWWENVPVLGWLAAGGRARCCGVAIPARYIVCEAAAGATSAAGVAIFGVSASALAVLVAAQAAVLAGCWAKNTA